MKRTIPAKILDKAWQAGSDVADKARGYEVRQSNGDSKHRSAQRKGLLAALEIIDAYRKSDRR